MIVNIYTITTLFVAFLSLFLGGFLIYAVLKNIHGFKTTITQETKSGFERKGYLIFLLACVTVSVRMLAWPWFYFMLHGFVSEVPGAMCMFGVTQILPATVTFLQIIKPVSFFIMGGWLLCYYVDKSVPTTPLARKNLFFLLFVCAVLLADSAGDVFYVFKMKPLMSVSCCATFFDAPLMPSAMIPQAVLGRHFQKMLYVLYYLTNIVLLVLLYLTLSKKWPLLPLLQRRIILYCQAVTGIVNVPVVIFSFFELFAPRFMQLPYHHCIYCLMGNGLAPDAPVMLGLFVVGTFAIGWMGILRLLCRDSDAYAVTERFLIKVNGMSVFCLLASVLMVTVHLLFT